MRLIDAEDLEKRLFILFIEHGVSLHIEDVRNFIQNSPTVEDEKGMVLYQAMIPLNPRTKKNSQQILINNRTKKPFITQNEKYKQYEKDAGWFLKHPQTVIAQPVNVKCIFYRDSARRVDLTNLLEAIDDILVKYKILDDDNCNIIAGHDGSRVLIDRDHPRTEIEITTINNL